MDDNAIDKAFEEGQIIKGLLYKAQGENCQKTIERFSYKFLEGLRKKDSGELTAGLIRLYSNIEGRSIPEYFKEMLKDISSMNKIGYAFLLGLNSYNESFKKYSAQTEAGDTQENIETNEKDEEE